MKFLGLIGALAIIIAVAAVVFFFGGLYNVAATQPDLGGVAWALGYIRDASINRHAIDQPPGSMEDPSTIQIRARALPVAWLPNLSRSPRGHVGQIFRGSAPPPSRS